MGVTYLSICVAPLYRRVNGEDNGDYDGRHYRAVGVVHQEHQLHDNHRQVLHYQPAEGGAVEEHN
jgi:hypothetical protein